MSQMRLYLDEDAMRGSLVIALRSANIDVVTASEVNRLGFQDDEQLEWAKTQQRVIYSFNVKDFSRLHNQLLSKGSSHAGIILVPRQQYLVGEQLRGVVKIVNAFSAEMMQNQILYLSNYTSTV